MPITIKSNVIKVNNNNGEYVGIDTLAETTTAEQIAKIITKGEETRNSVPPDFTSLSKDVTALQTQLSGISLGVNWEIGGISISSGNAPTPQNNIRIRTTQFIDISNIISITCNLGYLCGVFCWDSNDTYLGWYTNNNTLVNQSISVDTNHARDKVIISDIKALNASKIKIVAIRSIQDTDIEPDEGSNIIINIQIKDKIDELETAVSDVVKYDTVQSSLSDAQKELARTNIAAAPADEFNTIKTFIEQNTEWFDISNLTQGCYYSNNLQVNEEVDTSMHSLSGVGCQKISVKMGDKFKITGKGTVDGRLWVFTDTNNLLQKKEGTLNYLVEQEITAPSDGYLYITVVINSEYPYMLKKYALLLEKEVLTNANIAHEQLEDYKTDYFTGLEMFQNIAALGDSYTEGYTYIDQNHVFNHPYANYLSAIETRNNIHVHNYGVGGKNTLDYLVTKKFRKCLTDAPSDLYLICFGINDEAKIRNTEVPYTLGTSNDINDNDLTLPDPDVEITNEDYGNSTFYQNYSKIIVQIKNHAPDAKIVLIFPWPTSLDYTAINEAIIELAAHFNIPYINPADDEFFTSSFWTSYKNSGHPVPMTYVGMGRAIERLFSKCVINNPAYFRNVANKYLGKTNRFSDLQDEFNTIINELYNTSPFNIEYAIGGITSIGTLNSVNTYCIRPLNHAYLTSAKGYISCDEGYRIRLVRYSAALMGAGTFISDTGWQTTPLQFEANEYIAICIMQGLDTTAVLQSVDIKEHIKYYTLSNNIIQDSTYSNLIENNISNINFIVGSINNSGGTVSSTTHIARSEKNYYTTKKGIITCDPGYLVRVYRYISELPTVNTFVSDTGWTNHAIVVEANEYIAICIMNDERDTTVELNANNLSIAQHIKYYLTKESGIIGEQWNNIDWTENYNYTTNQNKGVSIVTENNNEPIPNSSSSWVCQKIQVYKGDKFRITGQGGSTPRLWAFTNNSYILSYSATANVVEQSAIIIAPEDGYLFVNSTKVSPHIIEKAVFINNEANDYSPFYRKINCSKSEFTGWYETADTFNTLNLFDENTQYSTVISKFDELVNDSQGFLNKEIIGTISGTVNSESYSYDMYEYILKPIVYNRHSLIDRTKMKILLLCTQHGFEKNAAYAMYHFLNDLLNNLDEHPELCGIRKNCELHIIPINNPWGFDHNSRLNANNVNLNRNYNVPTWELVAKTFPDPTPEDPGHTKINSDYGGDAPFSEQETKLVRNWVLKHNDALMVIDVHTNGQFNAGGNATVNSYDSYGNINVLLPSDTTQDNYYNKLFNAFAEIIEDQTLHLPKEINSLTPSIAENEVLGKIQITSNKGTLTQWVILNNIIGFCLELFNGFSVSGVSKIVKFTNDSFKTTTEILGNGLLKILKAYAQ